ncbi:MAG: hypothetical protein AMXMBFR80_22430 [Dehalococcoidia bacterium]
MAARFQVYEDAGGKYRWRLYASNNEIVASSGESFSSKAAARGGAEAAKRAAAIAPIEE